MCVPSTWGRSKGADVDSIVKLELEQFFSRLIGQSDVHASDLRLVVITHILGDRPFFLRALNDIVPVGVVLPKPKSYIAEAGAAVEELFPLAPPLNRSDFDLDGALAVLEKFVPNKQVIILDVGGYFASVIGELASIFSGSILGVVEDTENGLQRYERHEPTTVPVYSVARSPLKKAEDFLVGQSIVFSTEALLRQRGNVLHGRKACVIGYGRLGRSIAQVLHSKSVRTVVHDNNLVVLTEALAHGFEISNDLASALTGADLVLCATGNVSLRGRDFTSVGNGSYIATVTSSDDELDLSTVRRYYEERPLDDYCTRFSMHGHYFYILNEGNAVNFVHGAVVGTFIQLVQAELLFCVLQLLQDRPASGFHELDERSRNHIADVWLSSFGR